MPDQGAGDMDEPTGVSGMASSQAGLRGHGSGHHIAVAYMGTGGWPLAWGLSGSYAWKDLQRCSDRDIWQLNQSVRAKNLAGLGR